MSDNNDIYINIYRIFGSLVRDFSGDFSKKIIMKMQFHRISHTRSSPRNSPGCFIILSARLCRKDIHFVSYTNLRASFNIYTCPPRLFTSARVPLSFIFPRPAENLDLRSRLVGEAPPGKSLRRRRL